MVASVLNRDFLPQVPNKIWVIDINDLRMRLAVVPESARDGAEHERAWNCHDAAPESFVSVLKKERIKRQIYSNREAVGSYVFDYIEMFYNPIRWHGPADGLSPVAFEKRRTQNG